METLKIDRNSWMAWVIREFTSINLQYDTLNTCQFIRYLLWGCFKFLAGGLMVVAVIGMLVASMLATVYWLGTCILFGFKAAPGFLIPGISIWTLIIFGYLGKFIKIAFHKVYDRIDQYLDYRQAHKTYDVNVEDIKPSVVFELVKTYHAKICKKIELT